MAIVLEIDNGDNRGRVNYTRYLSSPSRAPAALRDQLNLPTLFDFSLEPADERFVPPVRGAYVRLTGLATALPAGGPRIPGPLFTGYITSEPEIEYLGVTSAGPVHNYRCQATSEEYILNIKRIGLLPPFLNQTAGGILRFLTERLQPGRFDLTGVTDGALVPYFAVTPEQTWSEIARELAERSGCFYRVLDGAVVFLPIGSESAGVRVDEQDRHFRPESLTITPLSNPIHNDVTVFGDIEPQSYVQENFVGDGFTSRFPLVAPVFGAESSRLLADDFSGAALDSLLWQVADPGGNISLFDGRLNITGGTGNLGETTLQAQQALELGGHTELTHGEFEFIGPSTGILGGLYTATTLQLTDCLFGFEATPIGGSTRLRPVLQGIVQPQEVIVQPNHHYVLVTRLSGEQPFRTLQTFLSLGASYGGLSISSAVQATLEVLDIDIANPGSVAKTVLLQAEISGAPTLGIFAPINSVDLHVVANFLQVTRPIQATLTTQKSGEAEVRRMLGFGIAEHDATITADPHRNQWALEFYEDTIPALGETVSLSYRSAGRARVRVVDSASIAAEAALGGDDGSRAVVLENASPSPRTSGEAELAAQAYLADHVAPRFEGKYATWGRFAESWPRTGALLTVNNPARHGEFAALVRRVSSEFRELAGEEILHTVEFGESSRFEELLQHFSPIENVLHAQENISVEPVDTSEAGTTFLPNATSIRLVDVTPGSFEVEMPGFPPGGSSYVVRRGDLGWGSAAQVATTQNLIGAFASSTFQLPRTDRHQLYYIRPVAPTGKTSRYSTVLAVHYPLIPVSPSQVQLRFGADAENKPIVFVTVDLDESQIADVDAVELRDEDDLTVLARWNFGQLQWEDGVFRAEFVLDNSVVLARTKTLFAYTVNTLGEYSPVRTGTGSLPVPSKPVLAAGNSIGQVLEILLDTFGPTIVETQVQAIEPGGSFFSPIQDVLIQGQPEKFNFVATSSGGWGFRARRRDHLGWTPWSDEQQAANPPQIFLFAVQFFQAHELDPSIGAAVNGQNLLPNAEFFLGGIAGQEGIHSARYFALVNAPSDGSEVDYSASTNEIQWKSGVSLGTGNPGFRSLLSNLGRLVNPGESLTLSVALRHTNPAVFSHAVRLALRSPGSPSYDQWQDVVAAAISNDYRWFSVTFTLSATQSVPGDLAAELSVVAGAGQSLNADLFCDKVILNRGHRPAAFSLAPWDVVALPWSSGTYDLPPTIAGGTPRTSDPGNAGRLSGTGTEDLDPDFTDRYTRFTA